MNSISDLQSQTTTYPLRQELSFYGFRQLTMTAFAQESQNLPVRGQGDPYWRTQGFPGIPDL